MIPGPFFLWLILCLGGVPCQIIQSEPLPSMAECVALRRELMPLRNADASSVLRTTFCGRASRS